MRSLRLEHLRLSTFRNLSHLDISLHPRFNLFEGDNGQGKSNLLEAIGLVGWQRSFRGARLEEMIQTGASQACIQARLRADGQPGHDVQLELRTASRILHLNGKRPRSLDSFFEVIQVVIFHPGELDLIQRGPEGRRLLLDRLLYQTVPGYATIHREHVRALRSRNRLLKEHAARQLIHAFDRPLAEAAVQIVVARRRLVTELAPLVRGIFDEISGGGLELDVIYRPRTEASDPEAVVKELEHSLNRDLARGLTSIGPQADELDLALDGRPVRAFASQGQKRAIVMALKCAEVEVIKTRVGQHPVLLLDDISSELDETRSAYLLGYLARGGGQVVMTTTHARYIPIQNEVLIHRIHEGSVVT